MNTYLVVVLVYFALIFGWALHAAKRVKNSSDYWVAGGKLGFWTSSASMIASNVSGLSLVGALGFIYATGWAYYCGAGGTPLAMVLISVLVASKLRRFNRFTLPDFFAVRYYSRFARGLSAVLIVSLTIVSFIAQMKGLGVIGETIFNLPYMWTVLLIGGALVVYTSLGGMCAVSSSHLIQAAILIVGVVLLTFGVLIRAGGLSELNTSLRALNPQLVSFSGVNGAFPLSMMIGTMLVFMTGNVGQSSTLVRIYAAKNARIARYSIAVTSIFFCLMYFGLTIVAMGARLWLPEIKDVDATMPEMIKFMFNPLLGGIVVAAIIAAITSTVDSVLLVTGSAIAHDIYGMLINPNASDELKLRVAKISTVAVGVIGLLLSLKPMSIIFYITVFSWSSMGAAFCFPLILGLHCKWVTREGAIAGMVAGAAANIAWSIHPLVPRIGGFVIHEIFVGLLCSFLALVLVSMFSPKAPASALAPFFEDVTA